MAADVVSTEDGIGTISSLVLWSSSQRWPLIEISDAADGP